MSINTVAQISALSCASSEPLLVDAYSRLTHARVADDNILEEVRVRHGTVGTVVLLRTTAAPTAPLL